METSLKNFTWETEALGGGGRRTCPSVTLSTTNPTWTGLGLNTGIRGVRLAVNLLSHCMAKEILQLSIKIQNILLE